MSFFSHFVVVIVQITVRADLFLPDYGAFHDETGFTDECWYGTASEDVCTNHGFCSTNNEGVDATCDCLYGWGGEFCSESSLIDICGDTWCFNNGECVLGLNGEEGSSCFCQTGYSGDDCEIEEDTVDLCEDVECSGNGNCVESVDDDWECECDVGFGGPTCGETLDDCDGVFLLDIFTRLAVTSGNLNASMECGYSKPTLFEDVHPAAYDTETFSYCVCADVWLEYGNDDYINQLATCRMDKWRPLTFVEQTDAYCPMCDDEQDEIMESLLTSKSDTCYHFIYQRETMGLYWRTQWKCNCMFSIGTPTTIRTVVDCPFTKHTAQGDYISWQNCKSEEICEWKDMYRYFEEEYSQIDLTGSVTCKNWMESWIFTTPDDKVLLEDMYESFCPCLESLRGHCDGCDHALNCIPITFHEMTMLETFDQVCFDQLILNRDCLNYIGYIAIEVGTQNFTAASMCYSAIELSANLYSLTDNLKDLMCGCLGPAATLLSSDSYQSSNFELALTCIDDAFAMDLADCPEELYDGDSYTVPVSKTSDVNVYMIGENVLMDESESSIIGDEEVVSDEGSASIIIDTENFALTKTVRFSSTNHWDSSSAWKMASIVEVVALVALSISAITLQRSKKIAEYVI